jgi:hypothetical protein
MYAPPNIIRVIRSRRMRWAGQVVRVGDMTILVGKPERKKPIGRPKLRWEDNIGMHLREIR